MQYARRGAVRGTETVRIGATMSIYGIPIQPMERNRNGFAKARPIRKSNNCRDCGKWFMSAAQLAHHAANAARLCNA